MRHPYFFAPALRWVPLARPAGRAYGGRTMPGRLSSGEREYATLVGQLRALEEDIEAARQAADRARGGRGPRRPTPREPAHALRGERVALADGAEIVIRPIEPEDRDELAIGFGGLGSLSRFRRFRQRIDRLTYE